MKDERYKIIVSTKGVVTERNEAYSIRIPRGTYGGYLFWIPKRFVTIKAANNLDGEVEEVLELSVAKEMTFSLRKYGEKRMITGDVLNEELDRTFKDDYQRAKINTYVILPKNSVHEIKEDSYVFKTPRYVDIPNYKVDIPDKYIDINRDGNFSLALPSGEMFTFRPIDGDGASVDLTAYQVFKRMDHTEDIDYDYSKITMTYEHGDFYYLILPSIARDFKGANATLIHMPQGSMFEGKNYFIPNNWIKEHGVSFVVSIPRDYSITLKDMEEDYDPRSKNLIHVSPEMLIEDLKNKSEEDYKIVVKEKENTKKQANVYMLKEDRIPKELKELDRWVAIKASIDKDGKIDKRPIDCHTGKYAKIDDPKTFGRFEDAAYYAKNNGCKTLAFALTNDDDISCIDVDHSMDNKTGKPSELLKEISKMCKDTYKETSISGQGAHIFLKMKDKDVRSFSKNNDLEFYQKSHFIAMTGDTDENQELKSFDGSKLEKYIDENFNKRHEIKYPNEKMNGLETVEEIKVVEEGKNMMGGDTFNDLYNGVDLFNDHSRSDMALMDKLAYLCNGDKETMLKIFATSGLYRKEKSREYYEHTAVKACEFVKDLEKKFREQKQKEESKAQEEVKDKGKEQ